MISIVRDIQPTICYIRFTISIKIIVGSFTNARPLTPDVKHFAHERALVPHKWLQTSKADKGHGLNLMALANGTWHTLNSLSIAF